MGPLCNLRHFPGIYNYFRIKVEQNWKGFYDVYIEEEESSGIIWVWFFFFPATSWTDLLQKLHIQMKLNLNSKEMHVYDFLKYSSEYITSALPFHVSYSQS